MAIGQFDACVVNYDLDTNYQIGHRSYKRDNFLAKCHSAVINYNHKVRQEKTDQISINSGMSALPSAMAVILLFCFSLNGGNLDFLVVTESAKVGKVNRFLNVGQTHFTPFFSIQ